MWSGARGNLDAPSHLRQSDREKEPIMTDLLFDMPERPSLPVAETSARFGVRRIFCVGRNYAAHAAEMGNEVDREAPWYFTKSGEHLCQSGQVVPYPPGTQDYHHEVELVVALEKGGFEVPVDRAEDLVFGHACGLDMTRRDRQKDGKDNRRPWSLGKDVENAAVVGTIRPGPLDADARIALTVNGDTRQDAHLSDMVWSVAEVIAHLSRYYHLNPGDLIMTGTPAGVGPVVAGDRLVGTIDGLDPVEHALS